jgi:hypothetical protein
MHVEPLALCATKCRGKSDYDNKREGRCKASKHRDASHENLHQFYVKISVGFTFVVYVHELTLEVLAASEPSIGARRKFTNKLALKLSWPKQSVTHSGPLSALKSIQTPDYRGTRAAVRRSAS